jgi:hypothetical protein
MNVCFPKGSPAAQTYTGRLFHFEPTAALADLPSLSNDP